MKGYDLLDSGCRMTESDEDGGEYVLREDAEKAVAEASQSTYIDDVIAVMRATIEAQRAEIARLGHELLLAKPLRLRFDRENAVLAAAGKTGKRFLDAFSPCDADGVGALCLAVLAYQEAKP